MTVILVLRRLSQAGQKFKPKAGEIMVHWGRCFEGLSSGPQNLGENLAAAVDVYTPSAGWEWAGV